MGSMPVAVVENGVLYYVRTDHIGRPVFATDAVGTKVWEASYLPFGGVHTSSGSNINLRFPGQWFQSESGLHQNWMRDYDPTLGRYIQADPLGLVDGASVYNYALQNPGRFVDPKGTCVGALAIPCGIVAWLEGGSISGSTAATVGVAVVGGIAMGVPSTPTPNYSTAGNVIPFPGTGAGALPDDIVGDGCGDDGPEQCPLVKNLSEQGQISLRVGGDYPNGRLCVYNCSGWIGKIEYFSKHAGCNPTANISELQPVSALDRAKLGLY